MKLIVAFCNFVNVLKNGSENRREEHIGLLYLHFMPERSIIKEIQYCLLNEKIKLV